MGELLKIILETIWLFLPAGVANTAPVLAARYAWFPSLNRPIHEPLLGSHKTWRGLIAGIIFGSVTGLILGQGLFFGAALGFGALAGDAAKSFVKRRLKIAPGKNWPPFDQVDYVAGAAVAASFFLEVTVANIIIALIIFGLGSLLVSYVGMQLKLKKSL